MYIMLRVRGENKQTKRKRKFLGIFLNEDVSFVGKRVKGPKFNRENLNDGLFIIIKTQLMQLF